MLVAALWTGLSLMAVGSAAGVAHLVCDLLLHHDDGRAHFWPITVWVFENAVSHRDSAHHAGHFAPVAAALSAALVTMLRRGLPLPMARALFAGRPVLEVRTARQWLTFLWTGFPERSSRTKKRAPKGRAFSQARKVDQAASAC